LPDKQVIENLGEELYKHLGILEVDGIKMDEMKDMINKEYYKQIKKL